MRNNFKPKQLKLNPLSIAKYFWEKLGEKGVEQTFLQPITYLTCQEILKKENVLLAVAAICIVIYFNQKLVKENKLVQEIVSILPIAGGLAFGLNTLAQVIK